MPRAKAKPPPIKMITSLGSCIQKREVRQFPQENLPLCAIAEGAAEGQYAPGQFAALLPIEDVASGILARGYEEQHDRRRCCCSRGHTTLAGAMGMCRGRLRWFVGWEGVTHGHGSVGYVVGRVGEELLPAWNSQVRNPLATEPVRTRGGEPHKVWNILGMECDARTRES